jgi:TPP-dependent pyruvate/acetoin dehydrogenase alpha subunit
MGTALARHQSEPDIRRKGEAYGIPADAVDGMDVLAVEAATRRAAEHARSGSGPFLLELKTYRFRAHSMADPELYRSKDEVEAWRPRDPLALFTARLRAWGLLDDAEASALEASVDEELREAVRFAEAGPWEPVEELTRHVYAVTP